jgi:hypothetical protein
VRGCCQALKLEAVHSLRNMHGIDSAGVLRHFASPLEVPAAPTLRSARPPREPRRARQVIEQFVPTRLALYERRKEHQLAELARAEALLAAKARFISDVVAGEIEIARTPRATLFEALRARGFAPQLEGGTTAEGDKFGYLLGMPLLSMTAERIAHLQRQLAETRSQAKAVREAGAADTFKSELAALAADTAWQRVAGGPPDGAAPQPPAGADTR